MKFELRLQDPVGGDATLLDLLLQTSQGMDQGGGVFSFASVDGVRLLLENPMFVPFLQNGSFHLVLGIDAVTPPEVLGLLADYERKYSGFRARVFVHDRPGVLFHPKYSWFANNSTGAIIVGSGNLTRGGLLKNWEAMGYASVRDPQQLTEVWSEWWTANTRYLFPVSDEQAIAKARQNRTRTSVQAEADPDADLPERSADTPRTYSPPVENSAQAQVLLAEIPKGRGRWGQANFNIDTYRGFFELEPGVRGEVTLHPVREDGTTGEPEVRQGVTVRSRNYRIELGQATGDYPSTGRPIGLFLKLDSREFRYRVLMPGQPDYDAVSSLLRTKWNGNQNQVRRVLMSYLEFETRLPDVVL